jgi:hypothetical protein
MKKIFEKSFIKYPRTYHLPWSQGKTNDDKVLKDISCFANKEIVVSIKLDGENTTLYNNYIHARSLDSRTHPSQAWVKNFWNKIKNNIPDRWRICGENLYAKHSIFYENLDSYFYGFSIWDDENTCLSWDETLEWFSLLGVTSVPVLYIGKFEEKTIKDLVYKLDLNKDEGYVVRLKESFNYTNFKNSVAKFVRGNHVQTDKHWKTSKIIKNKLKEKEDVFMD